MPADMDRPTRKSVLVVDDSPEYIELVTSLLKDTYRIRVATSGSRAPQPAFQPLRRTVQRGVDRRFARDRYSANVRIDSRPNRNSFEKHS